MSNSPESVVRALFAVWVAPTSEKFAELFAEDAIWVDGPNGVHRGAKAVVEELTRQLSIFPGGWIELDTLVADAGTVMVEWHGGFTAGHTPIDTKVMVVFEVNADGRITQMRECFDMGSLVKQLADVGIRVPG